MIVDGFTLFNELDLLEIRLEELYPVVDRFIIVEGDLTFRGREKPLYFAESIGRYSKYIDKIDYRVAHMSEASHSGNYQMYPWENEFFQRNQIGRDLDFMSDEDIILISDVDEIPKREIIDGLEFSSRQLTLNLRRFSYGTNMQDFHGGSSMKAIYIKDFTNAQDERMMVPTDAMHNAGWEFSSCGDPAFISQKLQSFSHMELDVDRFTDEKQIAQRILNGIDIIDRHSEICRVEIDDSWPHAIVENRERYRHLEW